MRQCPPWSPKMMSMVELCGIDLHAEYSQICILDEDGEVMETSRIDTSRKALKRLFSRDLARGESVDPILWTGSRLFLGGAVIVRP